MRAFGLEPGKMIGLELFGELAQCFVRALVTGKNDVEGR